MCAVKTELVVFPISKKLFRVVRRPMGVEPVPLGELVTLVSKGTRDFCQGWAEGHAAATGEVVELNFHP